MPPNRRGLHRLDVDDIRPAEGVVECIGNPDACTRPRGPASTWSTLIVSEVQGQGWVALTGERVCPRMHRARGRRDGVAVGDRPLGVRAAICGSRDPRRRRRDGGARQVDGAVLLGLRRTGCRLLQDREGTTGGLPGREGDLTCPAALSSVEPRRTRSSSSWAPTGHREAPAAVDDVPRHPEAGRREAGGAAAPAQRGRVPARQGDDGSGLP